MLATFMPNSADIVTPKLNPKKRTPKTAEKYLPLAG
jgi:hypothetical protein